MSSSLSLTARALLAIGLLILFYVLAIAIAGGLLFIPYAMLVYGERLNLRITLGCLIGAGVILWSIVPRPDRFSPPGPRLKPDEQPKLFELVSDVAQAARQEMPVEVYLVPDINAWVANRGGIMGLGSRRVMGIGLPLLQILTVTQLRAVLAHESGHYQAGDTKLGPWIYKTRAAIGRTIAGLARHSSLLQQPFLWYGKLFLRITHAVARRQEFAADALASRIAGSRALVNGLRILCSGSPAFQVYWNHEVAPTLNAGFRPPLAAGFGHFVTSASGVDFTSKVVEHELTDTQSDPYDTHPSLRDRIAAVEGLPPGEQPGPDPPAISLLDNVPELETALLSTFAKREEVQALKPVKWEEVGLQVYLPMWENVVRRFARSLAGVTPLSLPEVSQNLAELGRKLGAQESATLSPDEQRRGAGWVLGAALAVSLHRQGWTLGALPGEEVFFQCDEIIIKPFKTIQQLAAGELEAETWREQCAAAGISGELARVNAV